MTPGKPLLICLGRIELILYFYLQDGVERLFITDTGEGFALHIHCSGLTGDSAHGVHIIVLLGRWSWEGHLLVAHGKTPFSTFTVQISM